MYSAQKISATAASGGDPLAVGKPSAAQQGC
jgi:hypothetical protein